jgi:hypothetical protein
VSCRILAWVSIRPSALRSAFKISSGRGARHRKRCQAWLFAPSRNREQLLTLHPTTSEFFAAETNRR